VARRREDRTSVWGERYAGQLDSRHLSGFLSVGPRLPINQAQALRLHQDSRRQGVSGASTVRQAFQGVNVMT
jgi:hypothetical protein